MRPTYCTQCEGDCQGCSLSSYGRDCANNPIYPQVAAPRRLRGRAAMMAAYDGHKGPETLAAVRAQIPEGLAEGLTYRQLGLVMSAINRAHHAGRASCGAEIIDGDAIWINSLGRLYELADIGQLPGQGRA